MRLLIVEDSADDAELLLRLLRGAGYQVEPQRVETAAAMAAALDTQAWDLIIADYTLPHFSGLAALELVQKRGIDLPFIVVSGTIGEEVAVGAMRAGAHDYILKGHLKRLIPAIERELRESKIRQARRHAEAQLGASEERLRLTLEKHGLHVERVNRELERKNEKLAELYSNAQRFVDNVSHEFRTPLTVIKGYAELMLGEMAGPVGPQQNEFLGFIIDRTRDLAQMVDDLLDSSKLRAGTLRVDRRPIRIADVVAKIRPVLVRTAAANKLRFVEEIDQGIGDVFADAEKVGRVIINLVVNAIKFSPEGSQVTLWARPTVEEGYAEIGVSDHGPGIAPENLAVIFERFKQVGDPQRSSTKGFGLGLNIAKELVALNLGTMHVSSHVGEGSTFSFTLPPSKASAVLRRHLDYLDAVAPDGDTLVAVRIEPEPSGGTVGAPGGIRDELHGLIASTVKPLDLILETSDGAALLVVGCSANPERFTQRLRTAAESFASGHHGGPTYGKIHVDQENAWPYPGSREQAVSEILQILSSELSHA